MIFRQGIRRILPPLSPNGNNVWPQPLEVSCVLLGGGRHKLQQPFSEEIYDPQTRKWKDINSMTNKRWGCAADSVGGQLCVVEGYGKMETSFRMKKFIIH